MQSVEGYNNYIHSCINLIKNAFHSRVVILDMKSHLYEKLSLSSKISYSNTHYIEIIKLLQKQSKFTQKLKKKKLEISRYALHHVSNLNCSTKTKNHLRKKLKQLMIIITWVYSQSYFVTHQKKALNSFIEHHSTTILKINKLLHRDFSAYLIKEERELSLAIKVFENRSHKFFKYNNGVRKLERVSIIEQRLLQSAIACNSLPIHGVGDLLSLPFWTLYGITWGYEHTFKEFKSWKKSKKACIKDLREELERLENTL